AYMSPEQIRGKLDEVGPPADVYSLGVILYELLTGELPFRGQIAQVVYAIVNEQPVAIQKRRPDIDARLEDICNKMMAKRLDERYQSMDDVASDLGRYLKAKRNPQVVPADASRPPSQASHGPAGSYRAACDDQKSAKVVDEETETGVLNQFFEAQSVGERTQAFAEPSTPDSGVSLPAIRSDQPLANRMPARRHGRRWGLALFGLLATGLVLLSGAVIYFPDGSRLEVDDNASAKIEVDSNGAIKSVLITPDDAATPRADVASVVRGNDAPPTDLLRPDAGDNGGRTAELSDEMTPFELLTSEEYQWSDPHFLGLFPFHAKDLDRQLGDFLLTHTISMAPHNQRDGVPSLFVLKRNLGDSQWRSTKRLPISSNKWDFNPNLSRDGLHLAFQSNRAGGKGPESDLWYSRRDTVESPWTKPVVIGRASSVRRDEKPFFAEGSLALYFNSARVKGTTDIYVTRRASLHSRWSLAQKLGPEINLAQHNTAPVLSADKRVMIFSARGNRFFGMRNALWMSTRDGT
ncbi:MAG: hypothetical protein AAFN70_12115, partial [Planctomycetota bacterium]